MADSTEMVEYLWLLSEHVHLIWIMLLLNAHCFLKRNNGHLKCSWILAEIELQWVCRSIARIFHFFFSLLRTLIFSRPLLVNYGNALIEDWKCAENAKLILNIQNHSIGVSEWWWTMNVPLIKWIETFLHYSYLHARVQIKVLTEVRRERRWEKKNRKLRVQMLCGMYSMRQKGY